jgi:Ser/Thr protein kinase RdoA (MazF antagonist)
VVGPTMLDDLVAHPDRLDHHAATLADLHRRLDAVLIDDDVDLADGRWDETVTQTGLIHGDLHPANVLLSSTGPVLIDWTNHQYGPRRLDLAVTWIILACFGNASSRRSTVSRPPPDCRPRSIFGSPILLRDRSRGAAYRRS